MKKFLIWVWGMLILFLVLFGCNASAVSSNFWYYRDSETQLCRDVEFVFARGSGQTKDTGPSFAEFKKRMSAAAEAVHASYRVTDLDYTAVAIRTDNILGIYASAGEAYDFGASVDDGVSVLWRYYNSLSSCRRTYWVVSGYSQGAMVVANALSRLDSSRVVYVPLFGDPKLYLPEGKGFNPPACRGQNLSDYRVYVPNCDTDNGILGARSPYEVDSFEGLMGLWCGNNDFICGSSKNPLRNSGHSQYVSNGSIRQAANIVKERLDNVKPDYIALVQPDSSFVLSKKQMRKVETATIEPKLNVSEIVINIHSPLMLNVEDENSDLEYEWLIGDRKISEGGLLANYYFEEPGCYVVKLRAHNANTEGSSYVLVWVASSLLEDDRLPAPETTAIQRGNDSFRVSWTDIPERARYFGIRVKDYFLGYTEASNGEIIITDVNFEDISAGCFWFTEEMDMGYSAEINIQRLGDNGDVAATSATMDPWQKMAIMALPFLGGLIVLVLLKIIRDFMHIKNAPEIKSRERMTRSLHCSRFKRRASMRATLNRIQDGNVCVRPSIQRCA